MNCFINYITLFTDKLVYAIQQAFWNFTNLGMSLVVWNIIYLVCELIHIVI